MLRRERLATVGECHPGLATHEIRERQIRGVATVAECRRVGPIRLDAVEQRIDRNPLPDGVELAPFGDAVDIDGDRLARQCPELIPGPPPRGLYRSPDGEVPLRERCARGRPGGKYREIRGEVLPGRDPTGNSGVLAPASAKPARDEISCHASAPAASSGS